MSLTILPAAKLNYVVSLWCIFRGHVEVIGNFGRSSLGSSLNPGLDSPWGTTPKSLVSADAATNHEHDGVRPLESIAYKSLPPLRYASIATSIPSLLPVYLARVLKMAKDIPTTPVVESFDKDDGVNTHKEYHNPTPVTKGMDKAAELIANNERIVVTPEENKRVLRKIDLVLLPILLSVYFLQSLDKTTLSYASVFGLIEDANLDPSSDQYSWLGSIVYIAQMVMQPLVALLLVKLPIGKFLGGMVFTWGAILCGMAGAKNFGGLMATRFLLGAFEAAVGKSLSSLK